MRIEEKKNNCTLIVNSYDGGEDLWEGFFTCLKYQWPGFSMPIVLNTESKKYHYDGFSITSFGLYPDGGRKIPWSKRFIETLKRVDTEYVLVLLEDFWLETPVDTEHFEKTLNWMRNNPEIACFSYQPVPGDNIKDERFPRFERLPQKRDYRMNCQAALWRRERLIAFLRPHESPWEFERWGSIRSQRYKDLIYTLEDNQKPVFCYDIVFGGAIHRGRWNKTVAVPIAEKYGLNIDFEVRGFYGEHSTSTQHKRNLWRGIKNRINIIRSLI